MELLFLLLVSIAVTGCWGLCFNRIDGDWDILDGVETIEVDFELGVDTDDTLAINEEADDEEEDTADEVDEQDDVDDDGLWFNGFIWLVDIYLGDEVSRARLNSVWPCLPLEMIVFVGEFDTDCVIIVVGDEQDDDEQIDCGRPPNFNDFGSNFIGVDAFCWVLVGVIKSCWFRGRQVGDEEEVDDEDDKHLCVEDVDDDLLGVILEISFGWIFK